MTDDQKLLLLGAFGLVGSFFVGLAAIEGISKARLQARLQAQMHGPKQQHKSSKADDVVKFLGAALSLYTMLQQAPEMIEKANELLGEAGVR